MMRECPTADLQDKALLAFRWLQDRSLPEGCGPTVHRMRDVASRRGLDPRTRLATLMALMEALTESDEMRPYMLRADGFGLEVIVARDVSGAAQAACERLRKATEIRGTIEPIVTLEEGAEIYVGPTNDVRNRRDER